MNRINNDAMIGVSQIYNRQACISFNAMLGAVLGIKNNKMTEQEKSILLSKYEKIKGYSSDLFDNEEWAEFDAFCDGYNLAKSE